ncbi:serine/threonine protein kinase [Plantactinospora sp. KBS50]|nr:serine/threonine protein kinase [Plantactinospora sp. KBS50]
MGEVWPAHDTLLDRPVIVKTVGGLGVDQARRFRREALLTARFDHPGVPAVYDFGEHDGRLYAVIQRIDGVTLADLVNEQGPLPVGWVAAIGAQVGSVLLSARQIGLVHRDIKPSNVMLERSGAVKVLDFGLAVAPADGRYSRITESGQVLGTLGYMAPEQLNGADTDHRTDLYCLGATLFDLLTNQEPFDADSTRTLLERQLTGPPPRPTQLRPDLPAELDDLIHALLAVDPQDRPGSAAEVYDVLAPLACDLRPLPGVLDPASTVRAYAAIVGQVPQPGGVPPAATPLAAAPAPRPGNADAEADGEADGERAVAEAERLEAVGEFRAAARQWRRLASSHASRHGADQPAVFDFRLRAARVHVRLGEHDRAIRQLEALLRDRTELDGPEHPAVRAVRAEIARLTAGRPRSAPRSAGPDH